MGEVKKIILVVFVVLSNSLYSQGLDVIISEEKKGKRIVLFAENTTADSLNIFLLVKAEGYRKSASKPVVTTLAPRSRVPVVTLIELEGSPSQYTYDLVINRERQDVSLATKNQATDLVALISDRIVLFTVHECEKCDLLALALRDRGITPLVFNINENQVIYRQFIQHIQAGLTADTKIRFPIIWNKTRPIFSYEELEAVLLQLQ
jgi:hypothetical protein